MSFEIIITPHYLDASASVKLLVPESNTDKFRSFFSSNSNFFTTSLCTAETFGVLKRKRYHDKIITDDKYWRACDYFLNYLLKYKIRLLNIDMKNHDIFKDTEILSRKHQIDMSDSLQLVSLKYGDHKLFAGESKPILITADGPLAAAAEAEGLKVWNISKKDTPP